jgi:hypothetical protein
LDLWEVDSNKSNVDNLSNVRYEANRYTFQEKREYLKAKINALETNSKNITDLYSDISDFKKGYKPRINIVKDEKSEVAADPHSILGRWRKHFSQPLNIHGVNNNSLYHTGAPSQEWSLKPTSYEGSLLGMLRPL